MNSAHARDILENLAADKHPMTGKDLTPDGPLTNADVARALHIAASALTKNREMARALVQLRRQAAEPAEDMHSQAGVVWRNEHVRQLLSEFDAGVPLAKIARDLQRPFLACAARLASEGRDCKLSEAVGCEVAVRPPRKPIPQHGDFPI